MDVIYEKVVDDSDENTSGEYFKLDVLKFSDGLEVRLRTRWKEGFERRCWLVIILLGATAASYVYSFATQIFYLVVLVLLSGTVASFFNIVKEERLLVVKSLGYQIETNYVFRETTKFVPWKNVDGVFINEVITLQRVLFFLSIRTKEDELIPLFKAIRPRLKCLQTIFTFLKDL